ncbi:MAG: hypothetical protein JWM12_2710, partial [Ilumatobacteraceae bacterium]|nr:hypothetical protein [Ilumatobacteraceae bacterium]
AAAAAAGPAGDAAGADVTGADGDADEDAPGGALEPGEPGEPVGPVELIGALCAGAAADETAAAGSTVAG